MLNYDQLAADYAKHRKVHPEVLRQILQRSGLTKTATVLEVGCGTGNYIGAIATTVECSCWGIDPSAEMLAKAKEWSAIQFQQGNAEKLDFPQALFDLIFSVDVIHHVKDRPAFFREAYGTLKPGGRLCTVTDSEEIIRHRQPLAAYFPETVDVDLARYPSLEEIRHGMTQAGFREIDETTVEFASSLTDAAPYQARAFSCLQLIPDDAFQRGISRMESDLRAGPIRAVSPYISLWGRK